MVLDVVFGGTSKHNKCKAEVEGCPICFDELRITFERRDVSSIGLTFQNQLDSYGECLMLSKIGHGGFGNYWHGAKGENTRC
jgi:hypothetical protein